MNIRNTILYLAAGLLCFSCVNEPLQQPTGDFGDGTATEVSLAIKGDTYTGQKQQRSMSDVQPGMELPSLPAGRAYVAAAEKAISNLQILIFDAGGGRVVNQYIANPGFASGAGGTVRFSAFPGSGMQIYVFANIDTDTDEDLKTKLNNITSLDAMKALCLNLRSQNCGLSRADRLTMVGNVTVNITQPHPQPIDIQLKYLTAKVTVTFTDATREAGESVTIDDWDIINIPNRSYLIEDDLRDAVSDGSVDDNYTATPGDDGNVTAFETVDVVNKRWTQNFYLFENRRGGRVSRALPDNPDDRYPDMKLEDTDQRGKAWYAPAGATYMVVRGTYTRNGRTNNVIYKIYLGANSFNDYNICRSTHYQYNVTVNGLNDIDIDTNVEWGNSSFSVTASGDLEQMDAHPDFRVLRIGATATGVATPGYVTVEVLNDDGTASCNWLSVSPLNLCRYGIRQAGNTAHQPFTDGEASYFVGSKYTIAAQQSFTDATYTLTRKLTGIPFRQLAIYTFQDVVVYADANDGMTERTAKVRIVYHKDEDETSPIVGQQEFTVAQQGLIEVSGDLYLERYEECGMVLQPGMPAALQGTNTAQMQWGYSGDWLYNGADRYDNGNYLTANAIYQHVNSRNGLDAPEWDASTAYAGYYRKKYPRTGLAEITEPSSLTTTGQPYYYPALTAGSGVTEYFDPVYNTTAARYCHEKNRDTNGNGIIDAEETFWYLPSLADMIHIAQNMPAGTSLTATYWTSTEEDGNKSWAYTFPATPEAKDKTNIYRVRCVRGRGVRMPEATLKSTEADDTKINLQSAAGSNGAFNIADITGLEWKVTSDASWLQIATDENGTGASNEKKGTKNKTFFAYAQENTDTNAGRTAGIKLYRAGMTEKVIDVTQERKILPAEITPTALELGFLAGESKAFEIDDQGSGISWTVESSDPSWLLIATDAIGTDATDIITGTGSRTLYVYSKSKSTTGSRTANIILSQVGVSTPKQATVLQSSFPIPYCPEPHIGWAGCNIYWDPDLNRLTFDDVEEVAHWEYQGVTFLWGALVAFATDRKTILYSPTPEVAASGYSSNQNNPKRHILLECHDPSKNRGDICRLMTELGWAPGAVNGKKWRLPTGTEFNSAKFVGYAEPDNTNGYGTVEYVDNFGRTKITDAYVFSGNTKLPLSGDYNDDFSSIYNKGAGKGIFIWAASPYWTSTMTYGAGVFRGDIPARAKYSIPRQSTKNYYGGVRCVLEK